MLDVALSGYLGQQPEAYVPDGKIQTLSYFIGFEALHGEVSIYIYGLW